MKEEVSADIQAIVDWEIDHNANMVVSVRSPWGKPVALMSKPLNKDREVAATLKWWEYRSPHWEKKDWVAGWESTISGDKVCGPVE